MSHTSDSAAGRWLLARRLELLLKNHHAPRLAMEYAEDRFYDAGLLPALGYLDHDDPAQFSNDLLTENPLLGDWLRLNPSRDPERLESVEELIEELTARSHLD